MIDLLLVSQLSLLYLKLAGGIGAGWFLGQKLSPRQISQGGKWLYRWGIPLSIMAFVRQADLSAPVWLAPPIAWLGMALGGLMAWGALRWRSPVKRQTQGSFILGSMPGNTGYLGYPICLTIAGPQYFAWALFFDLLGTVLGAYGVAPFLAQHYSEKSPDARAMVLEFFKNPALWGLGLGFVFRGWPLAAPWEQAITALGWLVLVLALMLIGLRLSKTTIQAQLSLVPLAIVIKMLVVPLVFLVPLALSGLAVPAQIILLLELGMPAAFATVVLAEGYDLDQGFAVANLACGVVVLLFSLPLWLMVVPAVNRLLAT